MNLHFGIFYMVISDYRQETLLKFGETCLICRPNHSIQLTFAEKFAAMVSGCGEFKKRPNHCRQCSLCQKLPVDGCKTSQAVAENNDFFV